ncbi:hypothetical protein ACHWQZ_G004266 [Mnemiopsis leidyi]
MSAHLHSPGRNQSYYSHQGVPVHQNGPGSKASSGEVSTDSNLTAVNFLNCNQITDVLPAVCTMDYIGCIIDGKWTVVDLEQADMQDENNLFFSHQGRRFRVETNNIVLQYSRGYPSMTALNAAFNDSEEETQTINTELSNGLRAAGIDKFKVKMKNGKPTEVNKGVVTEDDEDDRTISEEDFRAATHNQTKLPLQQEQRYYQQQTVTYPQFQYHQSHQPSQAQPPQLPQPYNASIQKPATVPTSYHSANNTTSQSNVQYMQAKEDKINRENFQRYQNGMRAKQEAEQKRLADESKRKKEAAERKLVEKTRKMQEEKAKAQAAEAAAQQKRVMLDYARAQEKLAKERQELAARELRLQEFIKSQNAYGWNNNMNFNQYGNYGAGSCGYQSQQYHGFGQFQPNHFQTTVGFCKTGDTGKVGDYLLGDKGKVQEKVGKQAPSPADDQGKCQTEFKGKYKVNIDGEWYTVPGSKVVPLDKTFCSIKFGGQSINVEKHALVKCDEGEEGTIETDAYEVFINKRWNVIKATDISPSKRQPGTFIVRMEGRSIRVSPASIRPLRGEEPFRSTRLDMSIHQQLNFFFEVFLQKNLAVDK